MTIAEHYARLTDEGSQTSPDVVRRAIVASLSRFALDAPILDLGTGVGDNLALLAAHGEAYGVDIAVTALASAGRIRPVAAADGAALPFRTASFGGAVCTEVLEHVENPAAVFRELGRVLRPGAVLLVTSPNYSNLVGLHKVVADRRSGRHDYNPWGAHEGGYEAFMTGHRLRRFAGARFELVEVRALDYGQALTGRFAVTDRLANARRMTTVMRGLIGWLERPHRGLSFLAWHGMHTHLVLRRLPD
jgi:SAM-dependent methyltransferase